MIGNFGSIPGKKTLANLFFGWPKLVRKVQVAWLWKKVSLHSSDTFLDLGSGRSNFTCEAARKTKAIGIDLSFSPELVTAQKYLRNLLFVEGSATSLPFKKEEFTKVLIGGTLQSVPFDEELLQETYRVMKHDGLVLASVLTGHYGVKRLYSSKSEKSRIYGFLKRFLNIPETFQQFENNYQEKLHITKYYTVSSLTKLFESVGFSIEAYRYVPSYYSSCILDLLLLVAQRFNIPLPNHPVYVIFYPLIWFIEKITPYTDKGNELILVARK